MSGVADWITFGQHEIASALRTMATAIETFADWIEGPASAPRVAPRDAKTRARIAATLDRARGGYVRATAPVRHRR